MRGLYIALVHHGVVHGGVYSRMAEELLHLLDGHTFVDGVRCERSPELVRMYPIDSRSLAEISQTRLHAADAHPLSVSSQGHEKGGAVVIPGAQVFR